MTADVYWPPALAPSAWSLPALENAVRGSGVNLAGVEQTVLSPAGRWAMTVQVHLRDRATHTAFAALMAHLRWGRGGSVLVPAGACLVQPAGAMTTRFVEPDSAIADFDDGLGFLEEALVATLAAPAALNATDLLVSCAGPLEPGMYFGLGDRLHQMVSAEPAGDGLWRVTVAPWTRAAHAAGADIKFRFAVCRMTPRAELRPPALSGGRFGEVTLELVESP